MAQLEYDESGSTFTYFLVLVYGLFLVILTYFLWPRGQKGQDKGKHVCQCGPCCRKRTKLETRRPLERIFKYLRIIFLVLLWILLFLLIYWALTQEREYIEWDPYDILQIDRGATTAQIRKQYRELSKLHHPDKGGDPEVFTKIAKAYEALTNEEAKENWEKYGNPDGPQAASFGIALPSWIVDKRNSLWVLGTYILIFMIGLPAIVGTWWYRSVKYGTTNILIQTSQLYTHLLSRAKTIPTKRIITILATAIEFSNNQQAGVKDRPSDDIYLNQLVKQLEHSVRVDTREQPFCRTYVAKARLLLHSYLEHIELQDPGLLQDQDAIIKYAPHLINEMLNILTQIWTYSKMQSKQDKGLRKIPEPSADMYENVMRINQMLVQALWVPFQPLLQLPHVEDDHLRYFISRKYRINTIEEFCALKSEERKRILKSLSDEEYHDVLTFCSQYPCLSMTIETEVPDDEDTSLISAGSLVTVKIYLTRTNLLSRYGQELNHIVKEQDRDNEELISSHLEPENKIPETLTFDEDTASSQTKKETKANLVKQQQRKKKKGKGGASTKGQKKKPVHKKAPPTEETQKEKESKRHDIKEDDNKRGNENDESSDELGIDDDNLPDDEKEWNELQKSIQKEREQKKNQITTSHIVHAPYFPAEKQELWWAYIIDKKSNTVIVPPEKIVGLQDYKEVNLRLIAEKKGTFKYTVVINSDSYLYCMIQQELSIKVHEKKEVSGTEQWAELEKEEEEEDVIEESVTESEGEEESDVD